MKETVADGKETAQLGPVKPLPRFRRLRDPNLVTRHIAVYNAGPAVGIGIETLRRVFLVYGAIEDVVCPVPTRPTVYISYVDASAAALARRSRNRPADIEQRIRGGDSKAATASDVFSPSPDKACPLLGRWLKVDFVDRRVDCPSRSDHESGHLTLLPFDVMAATGESASDNKVTDNSSPCPLCARPCAAGRGLRMHIIDAHSADLQSRDHLLSLLTSSNRPSSPKETMPFSRPEPRSIITPQIPGCSIQQGMTLNTKSPNANAIPQILEDTNQAQVPRAVAAAPAWRFASGGGSAKFEGVQGSALSPGLIAARDGDLEALQCLVEGPDKWNPCLELDKYGSGALEWAAGGGHLEVCRYLIFSCGMEAARANPRRGRAKLRTPLHWAARGGHEMVCQFLIQDSEHHPPSQLPKSPMLPLDAEGQENTVKTVAEEVGKRPRADDKPWREVGGGCGVLPDPVAGDGTTPFHWAVWGGHLPVCKLLYSYGADPCRSNSHGCTSVHWAALSGNVVLCRWLNTLKCKSGGRGAVLPLDDGQMGSVRGARENFKQDHKGGLDWGKANLQGHTACHKAALKGQAGVLKWLLRESGVAAEAWGCDQGGYRPADVAQLAGYLDLAKWLEAEVQAIEGNP